MQWRTKVAALVIVSSCGLVTALSPVPHVSAVVTDEQVLALAPGNVLIGFAAAAPSSITRSTPITGLVAGETIVGIDIRPATGQLFGVGVDAATGHMYTIDPSSARASLVNDEPFSVGLPIGGTWSVDFNPAIDRIRFVHSGGSSYRLNPLNGTIAGVDSPVAPGTPSAVAHDRSTSTAPTATTLYSIDATDSTLQLIGGIDGTPSPNNGTTTPRGSLGVSVDSPRVGLDIGPTGDALATLKSGLNYRLYAIDLATGLAVVIGTVGDGSIPVLDIALPRPPVGPVLALTNDGRLLGFDASTPGVLTSSASIAGLATGERIVAFDVRPATGEVIAVGVKAKTGRLYRLNASTGVLTPIGTAPFATDLPSGGRWAVDINPVIDRVRLVHSSGASYRINPSTAELTSVDTAVSGIELAGAAYDRSTSAAELTTLYAIDDVTSTLNLIGGPDGDPSANDGVATLRGPLGVTVGSDAVGFDITPFGEALASFRVAGFTRFYTVDLGSGRASAIGLVGGGTDEVIDIAALPNLPQGASQFTPVAPARLLDTREFPDKPHRDTIIDLQVTGLRGVPSDATAVVLNVTGTEATDDGFLTIYPSGEGRPLASNTNLVKDGTKASLTTSKIGEGGRISIYVQSGAHVVVDVFGYYAPPTSKAGRFVPLSPGRLIDTRDPGQSKLGDGGSVLVPVLGQQGVPVAGVSAVMVNLTVTDADGPGFVQVFASDIPQPSTSNLNVEAAGGTVSNLAVVPVGADGKIIVFTQRGAHVIVDVAGWFSDDGTRGGYRGMFVPMSPTRVLDTRRTLGGHLGPVEPQGTVDVMIAGEAGVPMAGAAGVIANLTAVNPNAAGYVTLFPNGTERALAASLNVERKDQIVPNLVASPIGVTGKVTIFHQAGGDLVLDVAGWFTS